VLRKSVGTALLTLFVFWFQIGDFGLAQEIESNQSKVVLTTIYGTQFYLPNDFLRDKQLNSKVCTLTH
jgi:hypothetical protein